jgi:tetratricopeptide (TPR) repeat protein
MALENAGRDSGEIRQALIDFCEESFRRFPREDQLLTENRRRTMAQAYFDAGMTEKAEELFRSWLGTDPAWGWGWIGWADCYLPGAGRPADLARAEKLLRRGYRVPGVRDRVYIAERLQEVCEDGGRPDEARQFGEQAERLRHEPLRAAARPVPPPANPAPPAGNVARGSRWGAMPRALAGPGLNTSNSNARHSRRLARCSRSCGQRRT